MALFIVIFPAVTLGGSATARGPENGQLRFEIPQQSLDSALKSYTSVTGIELFYESKLVEGRQSPDVRGTLTAPQALSQLLAGTEFQIRSLEPGTVTLLPPGPAPESDLAAIKARAAEFTPYFAIIQSDLAGLFCRFKPTETNAEQILIRLWISPSGAVSRAVLRLSDGSGAEQAYAEAVGNLVISEPPPPTMPQPVSLVVLPRASRDVAGCPRLGGDNHTRPSAHG